jgi:hypothetical protein
MSALYSEVVEAKGLVDDAQRNATRSLRESIESQNTINGYMLRVRELEGSLAALQALVPALTEKTVEVERLTRHNEELSAVNALTAAELERTRVEIARLNGLLEMIYRSRTWKLHTVLEKARGR